MRELHQRLGLIKHWLEQIGLARLIRHSGRLDFQILGHIALKFNKMPVFVGFCHTPKSYSFSRMNLATPQMC